MPHQAEDIWQNIPQCQRGGLESVLLTDWVKVNSEWTNEQLEKDFTEILKAREVVSRAIEPLRADKKIGSSLEVAVFINHKNSEVLKSNEDELANIFITSQAYVTDKKPENVLKVTGIPKLNFDVIKNKQQEKNNLKKKHNKNKKKVFDNNLNNSK